MGNNLEMWASLFDANIWIALAFSEHPHHQLAAAAFANATSAEPVALCRPTHQSLLRLLTTESIYKAYGLLNFSNNDAWKVADDLLALPQVIWLEEPVDLEIYWKKFTKSHVSTPKKWMDAYLAAFATGHGINLISIDQGFLQYPGLSLKLLRP